MSIIVRLIISAVIISAGGFSIGMLWGLYIEQKQHYIKLSKIKIKDSFMKKEPKDWKMKERWEYYRCNDRFYSPIVIDQTNYLVDGYTSYLIAKADGLKEVEVVRI